MSVGKGLASRLRERVIIQEPNTVDNGRGGRRVPAGEAAWRDIPGTIAAEIIPLRGGEAMNLGVQRSTQIYRVTIRKPAREVTTANRLLWGDVVLDIRTAPPSTDRATLVMTCENRSGQE
jgi:head-tail adaptor